MKDMWGKYTTEGDKEMEATKTKKAEKAERAEKSIIESIGEDVSHSAKRQMDTTPVPTVDKGKADTLKGPVVIGDRVHFSPYDLLRYETIQQKLVIIQQNQELVRYRISDLERNYRHELQQRRAEEQETTRARERMEQEFQELQREVETLYNVKIDDLSYDPHTGRLRVKGKDIPAPTSVMESVMTAAEAGAA